MSDASTRHPSRFKAALATLLEAQRRIDELARTTVESVRRLVDVRESLVPGANPVYEQLHGDWYRAIEREFVAAGFQPLGQYTNANKKEGTPPEKDVYYHFALSGDRTIVATWFLVDAKEPRHCIVLGSVAIDGAVTTTAGGITDNGLPVPKNRSTDLFPADTPVVQLLADHRAHLARSSTSNVPLREFTSMEEILADRLRQSTETAELRRQVGLGMFEPYLRKLSRGNFEDKGKPVLESILAHPEWWTGEAPRVGPTERLNLNFLVSSEESGDRRLITSLGLAPHGLPELQMRGVAANHCRAARYLMTVVARKLADHAASLAPSKEHVENRLAGITLTVSRDDVVAAPQPERFGPVNRDGAAQSVKVLLEVEEFSSEADHDVNVGHALGVLTTLLGGKTPRAPKLLTIGHPERSEGPAVADRSSSNAVNAFTADEWLRMSCERLGLDVPSAKPFSALKESMDAASRRAVEDLPAFRARINAGLLDGQIPVIKTGLDTATGTKEYVWVQIIAWNDDEFVGTLAVQPTQCPGFTKGQMMHVPDADVFDRAIFSATEAVEQPLTDVVAMDFGVDLRN
jgi:hypothetical protein